MAFAERGAQKYFRIGKGQYSREELRSAAYTGLVIAARKFDAKRGIKFTTFAFNWINQHLLRVHQLERRQSGWAWNPTNEEQLAGKTGMQRVVQVVPWPTLIGKDGNEEEFDAPQPPPDESGYDVALRRQIVLQAPLTKRERVILSARLDGQDFNQIGQALGLSHQRVWQIHTALMVKVRQHVEQWKAKRA